MQYHPDCQIPNKHADILNVRSTIGVYLYLQKGHPIYIGKAIHLKSRLLSHEQNAKSDPKESQIISNADTIDIIYTDSEFLALILEAQLISHFKPRYNVKWRDDRSYLYIKITLQERYPRVTITRREREAGARYFGPFDSTRSAEFVLKHIRRIVPFCSQRTLRSGGCFNHKLGLCDPCPGIIDRLSKQAQSKPLRRYRANINLLIRILEGDFRKVSKTLSREIRKYTKNLMFEESMRRRDALERLRVLISQGHYISDHEIMFNTSADSTDRLREILREFYPELDRLSRIECYDNSTLGFHHSTASMVVFRDGLPDKKEYRRFKLRGSHRDDFAMMQEVISRRLKHRGWERPDLLVIDGGKPQLRAVQTILRSQDTPLYIPIIAIAKDPDRIVIPVGEQFEVCVLRREDLGLRLVQAIRDESHRFAKKYHAYLRRKSQMIQ